MRMGFTSKWYRLFSSVHKEPFFTLQLMSIAICSTFTNNSQSKSISLPKQNKLERITVGSTTSIQHGFHTLMVHECITANTTLVRYVVHPMLVYCLKLVLPTSGSKVAPTKVPLTIEEFTIESQSTFRG